MSAPRIAEMCRIASPSVGIITNWLRSPAVFQFARGYRTGRKVSLQSARPIGTLSITQTIARGKYCQPISGAKSPLVLRIRDVRADHMEITSGSDTLPAFTAAYPGRPPFRLQAAHDVMNILPDRPGDRLGIARPDDGNVEEHCTGFNAGRSCDRDGFA